MSASLEGARRTAEEAEVAGGCAGAPPAKVGEHAVVRHPSTEMSATPRGSVSGLSGQAPVRRRSVVHADATGTTEELLDELKHRMSIRRYEPGETIVQAGDIGNEMYFIGSGAVNIVVDEAAKKVFQMKVRPQSVGGCGVTARERCVRVLRTRAGLAACCASEFGACCARVLVGWKPRRSIGTLRAHPPPPLDLSRSRALSLSLALVLVPSLSLSHALALMHSLTLSHSRCLSLLLGRACRTGSLAKCACTGATRVAWPPL